MRSPEAGRAARAAATGLVAAAASVSQRARSGLSAETSVPAHVAIAGEPSNLALPAPGRPSTRVRAGSVRRDARSAGRGRAHPAS